VTGTEEAKPTTRYIGEINILAKGLPFGRDGCAPAKAQLSGNCSLLALCHFGTEKCRMR